MNDLSEGYINIDGGNMYYKTIGEGEPIVFIHGGPGLTHNYFIPYFEELVSNGYKLIFYDQRGNGKSNNIKLDKDYISIDKFTVDIELLRKELMLEKIILVGHSMGGFFAIDYASKFTDKVEKIILLNTTAFNLEGIMKVNQNIIDGMNKYKHDLDEIVSSNEFKKYDELTLKKYFTIINKSSFYNEKLSYKLFEDIVITKDFMDNFGRINNFILSEYIDLLSSYNMKNIEVPILLITSEYDFIPIEISEYIKSCMSDCKVEVIEKCGHYSFIEKTLEVIDLILKWI